MLMPDWLARRAQLTPEGVALIADGRRWTFAELDAQAQALAWQLAAMGVGPGQRVAVLLANSPAFVTCVHALPRLGAVLVPLNTRLAPPELAWQLEDAGARLLVHDADHSEKAQAIAQQVPGILRMRLAADQRPALLKGGRRAAADGPQALGASMAAQGPGPAGAAGAARAAEAVPRVPEVAAETEAAAGPVPGDGGPALRDWVDLAAIHSIIYTSGTTGRPKGALLTYGNHWWSAMASCLNLGLVPGDRWLACLPLFHVGGLSILLRSVIYGIPVVLHRRFDAAAANRAIDEEGVTIVSLVAVMLSRMLDERGGRRYPAHLRAVLLGGGPAPRPLLERAVAAGVPVLQTYGLTETASQVATLAPEDALRKLGAAGKPLFPNRIRIVRDGRPAPPGEVGEITVAGPTVTPGYWNRPDATAAALADGWLRTGDMGYMDPEGYLYVVDRREDLIISGGENVYPAEVEAVLMAHPAVAEAAVVGVPDERWGQVPVAYVALRPGQPCTEAQLVAFCRERLAGYKVPARVTFVPELPKGASGKILRRALRERAAGPG
ncbi:MAG TPA: o-succinylbenzoate--CoA ligase [Limnochordales bacterium]|nr:o-succinylbenzoate--CoA ligase [Limnochordales bacterium]